MWFLRFWVATTSSSARRGADDWSQNIFTSFILFTLLLNTLVFSFFEAALRQFSSVSFSIGEAVSETGGDGFFLNLTYFFKFWGLLRWDTIDNVHCIYTVPFTEQLLNAPFSSLTHQMYIHTSYISKGFSGQWINSSFVLFCSGGESRSFHW